MTPKESSTNWRIGAVRESLVPGDDSTDEFEGVCYKRSRRFPAAREPARLWVQIPPAPPSPFAHLRMFCGVLA